MLNIRGQRRHMIFFFFNDTATTEIYTLSLHDALPIFASSCEHNDALLPKQNQLQVAKNRKTEAKHERTKNTACQRSEEHTSELQSRQYLVCRLLLEKKKKLLNLTSYLIQT